MVRIHVGQPLDAPFGLARGRPFAAASALSKQSASKGFRLLADTMIPGSAVLVEGEPTSCSWRAMMLAEIACPRAVSRYAWVYIVQTEDARLYVGHSRDVGERLRKHRQGIGSKYTRDHRGARLIFVEGPMPRAVAVLREAQLKRWSRAKKEALIGGDVTDLRRLSRSRD